MPNQEGQMDIDNDLTNEFDTSNKKSKMTEPSELYYKQLTEGCGYRCFNRFCRSNIGLSKYRWTERDATICAANLTLYDKNRVHVCDQHKDMYNEDIFTIDLERIQSLARESHEKNSSTDFVKTIGLTFGSSESLTLSFLKNPITSSSSEESVLDLGVDIDQLSVAFDLLLKQSQPVQNALNNAIDRLLLDLESSVRPVNVSYLRQFVILYHYPHITDPVELNQRFSKLLIATHKLPDQYTNIFQEEYIEKLSSEAFIGLHIELQNFIALRAMENEDNDKYSIHFDKNIFAAVKMIGLVYHANAKHNLIEYDAFQNETINEQIDIASDYRQWKKGNPSFCNHPFILTTENKSKILQCESYEEQNEETKKSIFRYLTGQDALFLEIQVFRSNLITSSLTSLANYQPYQLKKQLKIKFMDEDGIDEGGVQKEWFQLLVKEIFDPKFGMFKINHQSHTHWFNPSSYDFDEFELIGKVLGLAVYNSVILDLHFPPVLYKKLLDGKPDLEDLKGVDPDLYHGLKKFLEFEEKDGMNMENTFAMTFRVSIENAFGEMEHVDLKANGEQIPVTIENRKEFVDLYVDYILESSIKQQFEKFKAGFRMVCNSKAFHLFRYEELELLICGSPSFDFSELKKKVQYENGYTKDHPTIINFWKIMDGLSEEEKKKFLFFTTGSDRSPIGGLSQLYLVISKHGGEDSDQLPSAHTCYNLLLLPPYDSMEKLRSKLMTSLNNAEGFGMF